MEAENALPPFFRHRNRLRGHHYARRLQLHGKRDRHDTAARGDVHQGSGRREARTGAGKAAPARARTTQKPKTSKTPAKPKPATSDLSGLRITDIKAGKSILLDVADDDEDRFLQVGDNGKVDFTGTGRADTTMMSLHPAAVAAANRVVIKPPFWNEDLGDGYCGQRPHRPAGHPVRRITVERGS